MRLSQQSFLTSESFTTVGWNQRVSRVFLSDVDSGSGVIRYYIPRNRITGQGVLLTCFAGIRFSDTFLLLPQG